LGFGAIPGDEYQEEFAQRTEFVRGKGVVLSEWSSWGEGLRS
jgi:hypothetical protein